MTQLKNRLNIRPLNNSFLTCFSCQGQTFSAQCDQIWLFLKRLGGKIYYKSSPNVRQLYYEPF